jgi:hypothetical protein
MRIEYIVSIVHKKWTHLYLDVGTTEGLWSRDNMNACYTFAHFKCSVVDAQLGISRAPKGRHL